MTRGEAKRSRRGMLGRLKAVGYTTLEMARVVSGIAPVAQCLPYHLPGRPDALFEAALPALPALVRVRPPPHFPEEVCRHRLTVHYRGSNMW